MTGGTIQTSSTAISTVSTLLPMLGNRRALIHPTRPTVAGGGGKGGAGAART